MQNIFYLCASIGAIATAISLIYLFIKDYKKNNRISNIERVAEVLEKDLTLRYQPHLWINEIYLKKLENRVNFTIYNKREWCKLLEFRYVSGDLIPDEQNKHLPWELEPKFNDGISTDTTKRLIFTKNSSEKNLDVVFYQIDIIYEDRLGKNYVTRLEGQGANYSLTSLSKLDNNR